MGRLHCLTLGLFILAVRAEKEDFQGYLTEETKGTTVTKDRLLEKENTIGHGKEAIPTEKTHRHTVMAVTAKIPGVILFDTRPTQPYERIQITGATAIIALPSTEHFVSKNERISLTSTQDDPSTVRIKSEIPLSSNYKRIVFSSTQPDLESMMNGSSEPEVHLSADAVKAPPWDHAQPDVRNQRNTDSVTLTSADRGLGGPTLSASHPRVIDNLAEGHNDNDDKRSPGKVFSNLERNVYVLSTKQSILQSDAAKDSLRGNKMTKLCLTCLKDERGVTPQGSTDSHSKEGLTSDFNQLTTFLFSLHQQPAGEEEEQINHQSITSHSNLSETGRLVYNQTFIPYNKTSILNNSQIKPFYSDIDMVAFETQSVAEMSTVKKGAAKLSKQSNLNETFFAQRPMSATSALHLSKLFYTERKPVKNGEQDMSGKKVSIGDSQSKLIHFTEGNRNAPQNPSTNLKNVFIQRQPLDISSGSVNNMPVITETPPGSQRSVLPGRDHSSASLLAARMSLIQAHTAITPFSISRPTTSAVENPESHFLTGRADRLISVLRSKTPAKPSSQNKDTALTLLPKDSAVQFASVATKRHLTDKQDSQTFNTVHSIVTQSIVDPSGPVTKPVIKETQTFTTRKVMPESLFPSESSQDFGNDVSVLTLTTLSSESFSDKLTMSRLLATQSKIIPEGSFGVRNDKNVASTQQSSAKHNGILIRESLIVHSLKLGDKNEQVLTEAAENEEKEIVKMEGKQGGEIQKTKEILKLHKEGESRLENKREELFRLDKTESGKQGKMHTVTEINQNTHKEVEKMQKLRPKTSTEKSGRTTGEEDVTLRQDKAEIRDEEEAKRHGVTTINKENCTKCVATKQKGSLTKERPEARKEETSTKDDFRRKGEIGKGSMTNVPLGPTTNSEELNRHKGHTVTNLSSCHTLIKQLGTTKNKGVHLTENTTQPKEITNKSRSHITTSNHRLPQSTLRSQSSELSNALFFPKHPYTQIKDHQSAHRAMLPEHRATTLFTTESTQNKVVEVALSVTTIPRSPPTLGVTASNYGDALRPTVSTPSGAAQSTPLNSMLSLTTLRLAVTAGFLRAQSHFTVNSSTLNASIIYSILDHRHKFNTSVSKSDSILHPANEREQAEYIRPSVNPALHQQMYNDSSTRPPTASALSSQAYISTGQLQPHQGQPAPQISQSSSSSSDMTSGQPCSFKLSEQTAHTDALHAAVDDNEQRSAQTLMASMRPKAKNNQFPLSSMSTPLNLRLFGGDSLPDTYRMTGVTRSETVKNTLRDAESMSGTADETNQTEENNRVQTMVTSKHSQMTGKSKHCVNNTDEFSTVSARQASNNIHKTKLDGLINVKGDATTTTNKNNKLSLLEATTPDTFAVHTMQETEQAINKDFVHVMNDSVLPVLDTNVQTGTTAFVESNSLPNMQANDVTNDAIFDLARHTAKTAEKPNNPSVPPGTVSDSPLPASHINFKNDLTALNKSTQQTADWIMNVTSQFQITTIQTSKFSAAIAASTGGHIMSTEDQESLLSTTESVPVVFEKLSQAAHAEHIVQSNSRIEALSLRESLIAPATGKLTPAVRRKITTETQSVEQTEQSQHAPPAMMTITRPINDPEQSRHAGLVKIVHKAEWAQGPTSTMPKQVGYLPLQNNKIARTTEVTFKDKHPLNETMSAVHTLNRTEADQKHKSTANASISQRIFGGRTDSVPHAAISPTELLKRNNCRTSDCAKKTKTTTTTGATEIDHNEKAGSTRRDHFSAEYAAGTTTGYSNCSSGCFVPGKAIPPAVLSAVTNKSDNDNASVDETMSTQATSMTDKAAHFEKHSTPEQARFIKKSTQRRFHRQNSEAQQGIAAEVTSSEPEETTAQATMKTSEQVLLSEKNRKTQLNRKAGQAEILEAQNATRSVRAVGKGEMAGPESGRSLLVLEPESESELPRLKHRRTSAHLYLSGVSEVSDDLCGSGNYTAEMSVNLGTGVEPGDVVPAPGNLRVVINLRTNNSQINLGVTSCCLSPTIQPDLTNSTCCLFSRLAAEPAGITLLPSALSTSASFTISLFQMINYSVVYLHCDLSVCLRNHSDCERQCLQQRSAFSSEGPETIVANLRNRISFGPMLKQVKNSTSPEEIDPSQLDLVLVIISLVVGSCLVTVMLLLVWLAYRRRAVWLLQSAAPPRACCGCLHPGGDLILP